MPSDFDFLIIGSGFGGCLIALILRRMGYRVVVIDRATHPRFTIGESSTPIADSVLKDLSIRYELPRIAPLCSYGSAKASLPEVTVGIKRGFSYFKHRAQSRFGECEPDRRHLIVAASADDLHSDTHWLRSDVDWFFAQQLRIENIELHEASEIESIERICNWKIAYRQKESRAKLTADFIIDASGPAGTLLKFLNVGKQLQTLLTNSFAVYGHFADVRKWKDQLEAERVNLDRHPFDCDNAAVHQLIDHGWMWQLRFDNGICSAGFLMANADKRQPESQISNRLSKEHGETIPETSWQSLLEQYPSLADQFSQAKIVAPADGMRITRRLQYMANQFAGNGWACLPATAGFVDPMHSTGIAHTMTAIEHLAFVFEQRFRKLDEVGAELSKYESRLRKEFELVDKLVYSCYASLDDFELFVPATMLYFAAATFYEQRRFEALQTGDRFQRHFLGAEDLQFQSIVDQAIAELHRRGQEADGKLEKRFAQVVKRLLEPYNLVGLCDESVANMYRYTAAPH